MDLDLTTGHIEALKEVEFGGDVFGYVTAKLLRECEQEELVMICKVMGDYKGNGQLPYFGCIITAEGRRILQNYLSAGS